MPTGRKRAKEQLKNKGGHKGIYKNDIQVLLIEKEERKMKDLRWQEAKTLQESIVFIEECWLMWEQEQKIIRKNYRWLKSKSSHCFDVRVGDSSDGSRTLEMMDLVVMKIYLSFILLCS